MISAMNITAPPANEWFPDSGATDHVTSDLPNLAIHSDYNGHERVCVGDNSGLLISNVGKSFLKTSRRDLAINSIVHVPSIKRNLISVAKFTKDYRCFFEFSSILFCD